MVVLGQLKTQPELVPLDFSGRDMKRVLDAHLPLQHLANGGGKMTRLSPSTSPTNNNTLTTINNLINASALNLAPPNPMLLSRLVLPPRPSQSPGGSETPPHNDRDHEPENDFSDDDEGPKDFRGEHLSFAEVVDVRLA